MRKYFITGLVFILPIVLTAVIFGFLLNLLTKPFEGVTISVLDHFHLLNKQIFIFNSNQLMIFMSRLFVLIAIIGVTFLVGYIARWILINKILRLSDWLLQRIPLINKIYRASQETVTTIFSTNSRTFKQVVLVAFPGGPGLSIGLVTSSSISEQSDENFKRLVSVFIPGTPNPTVGFLLLFPPERITPISMSVEEALKFVISVGVMIPNEKKSDL